MGFKITMISILKQRKDGQSEWKDREFQQDIGIQEQGKNEYPKIERYNIWNYLIWMDLTIWRTQQKSGFVKRSLENINIEAQVKNGKNKADDKRYFEHGQKFK